MAFLASILMIGILNMASCHVNFPLLEALPERFNYQTNTFFLPTSETTPTLEEIARVSSLSLVGITYQHSTATDDHSIMSVRLLGAAYSSHGQWVDMELLVRNREQSRVVKHIFFFCDVRIHPFSKWSYDSSKFPYPFGPCLLGARGLHHCSGYVGGHIPRSS
ncbi:hypothetical protein AMTRI_Chr10g3810 [Amborella trichopoda]